MRERHLRGCTLEPARSRRRTAVPGVPVQGDPWWLGPARAGGFLLLGPGAPLAARAAPRRPLTAQALTRQLNQHGIHLRAARTAALVDLAGQLRPRSWPACSACTRPLRSAGAVASPATGLTTCAALNAPCKSCSHASSTGPTSATSTWTWQTITRRSRPGTPPPGERQRRSWARPRLAATRPPWASPSWHCRVRSAAS